MASASTVQDQRTTWAFDAIGAPCMIQTPRPLDLEMRHVVTALVEDFDATWSRFRRDSVVTALATGRAAATVSFDHDAATLFTLYDRLHHLTAGAIDPLVGHQLELLGYDPDYSLTPAPKVTLAAATADRPVWARDAHHRQGP
jgi:thiamine biosynthesis lipoprotein